MEKDEEQNLAAQWLKDLPVNDLQTFTPEEMLICEKCGRKTPPTRANCFYCGGELPVSALQTQHLKLNLRKLEHWEKGVNIIFIKQNQRLNPQSLAQIADLLGLESNDLEKLLNIGKPLPLARVESKNEAEIITKRLAQQNIESQIIEDEQLKTEIPSRRLRGIEFFDDSLTLILFNNDEIREIKYEDLSLVVAGTVFERKIESTESVKRKEKGKILDSSETATDELLIDIYTRNDDIGYRIESNGFDFSCLEKDKSLLAQENMKRLAEKLKSLLPNAKYDDDYTRIRGEIGKIWEVEEQNNMGGVGRKSFGSFRRTNTVTISNLSQFTRYSRLQKRIL